ncbi:MAG: hypothetical protein WC558_14995 [Patulibacter sp.]
MAVLPTASVAGARLTIEQSLAPIDPAAVAAKVDPHDEDEGSVIRDAGVVAVAAGEGAVTWAVRTVRGSFGLWVWTDGQARMVATLPEDREEYAGPPELEIGRTPSGFVVAVMGSWNGSYGVRLVRVDDGSTVPFPRRIGGRTLRHAAIDGGRVYVARNVVNRRKQVPRGRASLWRASIDGLTVGRLSRVRSSTRSESWGPIAADRGRVAVLAGRDVRDPEWPSVSGAESWLVGSPRGRWRSAGLALISDYGYIPVRVVGFTRDRRNLVMVQNDDLDPSPADVTRGPLRRGAPRRRVTVETPLLADETVIAYDGSRDRLVVVGPDASGTTVVGLAKPRWGRMPRTS